MDKEPIRDGFTDNVICETIPVTINHHDRGWAKLRTFHHCQKPINAGSKCGLLTW